MSKFTGLLNSRFFLIAIIAFLAMLLLKQCRSTEAAKTEALREHNNYLASQDSVRIIKKERDLIIVEKSAFEVKVSELNEGQKKLIKQLELAQNGKGSTPKTIIQFVTVYKDSIRNIVSTIKKDSTGKESIVFVHDPKLPGKNKFKISGKVPYSLGINREKTDTTKYVASLVPGNVSLDIEQNIDIATGIYRDPKSKRLMTRVTTTFPGLSFNEVNSFDITDNPDTRKALKSARKEFGIGLHIGYGITPGSIKPGIVVGIGINYTPRFLQFGK